MELTYKFTDTKQLAVYLESLAKELRRQAKPRSTRSAAFQQEMGMAAAYDQAAHIVARSVFEGASE